MARDKSKDDKLFNCGEKYEHDQVLSHYSGEQKENVRNFLNDSCNNGTIYHSTHKEIYQLIEERLGYPVPV